MTGIERINRTVLTEIVTEMTSLDKRVVSNVIGAVFEALNDNLAAGNNVELRGFGTFKPYVRKGRTGRNPRTGDMVKYGPKRKVRFTWSLIKEL